MAEVTAMRNNVLPYPVWGMPWAVIFPILDADGDLVSGATSLDSEVSKNGDTFADCTNEATEIGSTGVYYLLLTATEMMAELVAVLVKTGSAGAKTTPMVFYPRKAISILNGTAGGSGGFDNLIILDSSASSVDDAYTGMFVYATLDGNTEIRFIYNYTGSTKTASVRPDFVTIPDTDDLYEIFLLPESVQLPVANVTHLSGGATAAANLRRSAEAIYYGTVTGATTTTTLIDSGLTQTVSNHWNRRIIIFLTGALTKQAQYITGFDPSTDELVFDAFTSAPSAADTYVIL